MGRVEFATHIARVQKLWDYIGEVEKVDLITLDENNPLYEMLDTIVLLLEKIMKDDKQLIHWFCWENDFGREKLGEYISFNWDGIVIEHPCEDAYDLYDILTWEEEDEK